MSQKNIYEVKWKDVQDVLLNEKETNCGRVHALISFL